jgi:hypothetical protein
MSLSTVPSLTVARLTVCTYISGSVCLAAQIMFEPGHPGAEHDLALIKLSVPLLENLIQQTGYLALRPIQDTCKELLGYARASVPRSAVEKQSL